MKPVVDDTPPKLNISLLYDHETLKSEQKKIQSHYGVCPEIVRLLHNINVFGGRTETFAFDYQKLQPMSNFNERRCAALRIQEGNHFMKEMIETTVRNGTAVAVLPVCSFICSFDVCSSRGCRESRNTLSFGRRWNLL